MKILALEKEIPDTNPKQFAPHLRAEAAHANLRNTAPSVDELCVTLNKQEITGSLSNLDRRPTYRVAVILFPAEPEKAVMKWILEFM
jgi:hypothetical protein